MAGNYGSGGALFTNTNKKSPKASDYRGDVTLEGELLDYIMREAERGNPVKIELSGWKRQGRGGSTFISLSAQTPYSERGGQQQQPQFRQGRGSYNEGDGSGRYRDPVPNREPIQTSRGQYTRQQEESRYPQRQPQQGQGRQSYARNERFQQELNDEIPDFGVNRGAPF